MKTQTTQKPGEWMTTFWAEYQSEIQNESIFLITLSFIFVKYRWFSD